MATIEQRSQEDEAEMDPVSRSKRWGVSLEFARSIVGELIAWQEEEDAYDTYLAEGGATASNIGSVVIPREAPEYTSGFAKAA